MFFPVFWKLILIFGNIQLILNNPLSLVYLLGIKSLWLNKIPNKNEMELDKVIKERYSVRRFKKLEIPWYIVSECLEAATYAPSSGNVQNWHFIVIKEKENREKIVKLCEEQYWMLNAPVLIIVCNVLTKVRRLFDVRGEALYAVQNCAAAIENLLLKAYELGLGSTWIGAFNETELKEMLNIPGDIRPQAIIALGYGQDFEKTTREPLDNFVSFEEYGKREDKSRNTFPISETLKKNIDTLKYKLGKNDKENKK